MRRANVPIAFSQGFTAHPKISYASAAPTGVASEAEYLELALQDEVDPTELVAALDAALPPGIDILDAVIATDGNLADRIEASAWQIELPGVPVDVLRQAAAAFLAAEEVPVERLTKQGMRTFDARGPVVSLTVRESDDAPLSPADGTTWAPSRGSAAGCAILDCVVRLVTPAVRPDDVLSGLRVVAALEPPVPPRATRTAAGVLTAAGDFVDPLDADRNDARDGSAVIGTPSDRAG